MPKGNGPPISDLRVWDEAVAKLPHRAEAVESATKTFAETRYLGVLQAQRHQTLEGRRGTGKTHLLRRLNEYYTESFADNRVVPVLVSGSELRQEVSPEEVTPKLAALMLYVNFIQGLGVRLYQFVEHDIEPSVWDRLVGGSNSTRARQARQIAAELDSLLKGEVLFLPAGEASEQVQSIKESGASIGLSVAADPRTIGWSIEAGARRATQKTATQTREIGGHVVLPFAEVAAQIEKLLMLLDDARLVILFDEWSDVEIATQPYLAEMLKRTFAQLGRMYLKLACISGRTRLSFRESLERNPIGLELGDDITGDVDLDSVVYLSNDLHQIIPFFLDLLFRHMAAVSNDFASMPLEAFSGFVTDSAFDGVDTFSQLCLAAACIPRDFLHVLQLANNRRQARDASEITIEHIRGAALDRFRQKAQDFRPESAELRLLEAIYRNHLEPNESVHFLLAEPDTRRPEVEAIWSEKLIHRLPIFEYDREAREKLIWHQMDYGKYTELLADEAQRKGESAWGAFQTSPAVVAFVPGAWVAEPVVKKLGSKIAGWFSRKEALSKKPGAGLDPNRAAVTITTAQIDDYIAGS